MENGDGKDETSIKLSNVFTVHWKYILIGVIGADRKYTPRVFTPYKTAMQHWNENNERSVQLVCNGISLSDIYSNTPSIHFSQLSAFEYYCDGVNWAYHKSTDEYTKESINFLPETLLNVHSYECKVLYDYFDNNKIKTTTGAVGTKTAFRVLVTIDGKFVLQFYHKDIYTDVYSGNKLLLHNYVSNLLFNNDIDTYASGFVEICRGFCHAGDANEITNLAGLTFKLKEELPASSFNIKNVQFQYGDIGKDGISVEDWGIDYSFIEIKKEDNKLTYIGEDDSLIAYLSKWEETDFKIINFSNDASVPGHTDLRNILNLLTLTKTVLRSGEPILVGESYQLFISEKNGVSTMPSTNLWNYNGATFALKDVSFKNSLSDSETNILSYNLIWNNNTVGSSTINILGSSTKNYMLTSSFYSKDTIGGVDIDWKINDIKINGSYFNLGVNGDNNRVVLKNKNDFHTAIEIDYPSLRTNNIDINSDGVITYISDRRHKKNIDAITNNFLDVVNNTPVVNFNYLESDILHIGIISQDLEKNLLNEHKECFIQTIQEELIPDCKRLKETKLVYILWKAVQELSKEVQELKESLYEK